MSRSEQCLRACLDLSTLLHAHNISHAFSGGILTVALGSPRETEEIFCVAPGFKSVRQACAGSDLFSVQLAPWSSRLYILYNETIPPVQIEIVPAGEEGPRNLDRSTIMGISVGDRGSAVVPFLSVTEFLRKPSSRRDPCDAHDILFILSGYWESIDLNRIVEQDMDAFVKHNPEAKRVWKAIKRRYTS
ncbi:hypothetical protein PIIN_05798 [Serendipita indica DSM 11827]|uniref:Uncharacterized protein n=1 Tax=Serendipita indica (strain DSM 11827) TaxID=1109443 RepID=G4TKM0_SERID|nr:hypothetical protein PIIN_05798 [Serendipita indica DSM 11827]